MKKITLFILLIISGISYGQKLAKMTKKPISFTVNQNPEILIEELGIKYYNTEIITPINVLNNAEEVTATSGKSYPEKEEALKKARTAKLKKLALEYLEFEGKYGIDNKAKSKVVLETQKPKVLKITDKDIKDLKGEDFVFSFTIPSEVKVINDAGEIVDKFRVFNNDEEGFDIKKSDLIAMPAFKERLSNKVDDKEKQLKAINNRLTSKGHIIFDMFLNKVHDDIERRYGKTKFNSPLALFSVKGKGFDEINEASTNVYDAFLKMNAFSAKKRISLNDFLSIVKEALPVWEKGIKEKGSLLQEKALKGLKLNCVIGYSLINNKEKASMYLEEVPESIKDENSKYDEEEVEVGGRTGATMVTYGFKGYAQNTRDFFNRTVNNSNQYNIYHPDN